MTDAPSPPPPGLPAASRQAASIPLNRYFTFAAMAFGGAAIDLATKSWVFAELGLPGERPTRWLIQDFCGLQTSLNKGALFGMRLGLDGRAVYLFAGISVVAALAIIAWLFLFGAARDRWVNVALGGIFAGILGNLYDRLGLWASPEIAPEWRHAVRDWILFKFGDFHWPNFNVADSLLVCGVGMLVWHALFWAEKQPA